jgi:diguanylate cyclase (GGDEF)-like protein
MKSLLAMLAPWSRREAPCTEAAPYTPRDEQARLCEAAVRAAAQMLAVPCDARADARVRVQAFCDALVAATPHLRLAWTWFGAPDTPQIVPQVIAGPAADYARALRIERTLLTGIGPAFRALDGRRAEPFNVSRASLYEPWRVAAQAHGVRSVLAVPLASQVNAQRGIFVSYADLPDYFGEVGVGLFEAVGQLLGAVLSQQDLNARLAREARTDALTALPNRAHAQDLFAGFEQQCAQGRPTALMLLDLDHFKQINDRHGHAAGDAVLVASARALRRLLRRSDGLARWGGEEFLAWLPATDGASALGVADKLREQFALAEHALPGGGTLRATLSAGVATLVPGETVYAALERADRALYRAKRAGRNRVEAG